MIAAFHLKVTSRSLHQETEATPPLPHKQKKDSHISQAQVAPPRSLPTCTFWGARRNGCASSRGERGKAPNEGGREMGTGEGSEERGDEKTLIGGEGRERGERGERGRRLREPWEVLPNCQMATSCELFSVSLRAFVSVCVCVFVCQCVSPLECEAPPFFD